MPKIVDHEQRRQDIAHALWRVVQRHGLAGASVRTVAAEAGISAGALRHYFTDQDELIVHAMQLIDTESRQSITQLPLLQDPIERAIQVLTVLTPMDQESRRANAIWFSFAELSHTKPALHRVWQSAHREIGELCATVISWVSPHLDPEAALAAADSLHALVDGLALHGSYAPELMPPGRINDLLRAYLTGL